MPRPSRNRLRTVVPLPLGAHRTTSMSLGGTTLVSLLNTTEKPCATYSVLPLVRCGSTRGHSDFWPASESRYMMTVPWRSASSMSKRFLPGSHPSATAFSHDEPLPPLRTPTMTLSPLSRMLSACPRPCVPYPSMHSVSPLNISLYFCGG